MQANPPDFYVKNIKINSIKIDGNSGVINRTITTCLSSNCTGSNQTVNKSEEIYIYENGEWKIPEKEPSNRALSISSFEFTYGSGSEIDRENSIKNWCKYGIVDFDYAVYNYALFLDSNPEKMAKEENAIEAYKADQNRQANTRTVIKYLPSFPMTVPTFSMPKTTHCRPDYMGGVTCTTY
jgi:hypothetical protein